HLSLWEGERPVTHDASAPLGIAPRVAPFFAGVLAHLPAIAAFTAPSVASYYRLTPNKWAPVHANIARQDRGAAVRIAPVFETSPEGSARQFNVEYRVADASACPYLALGAVIWAGVDGMTRKLALPAPGADAPLLPRSLAEALTALERDESAAGWWSKDALSAYLAFNRAESEPLGQA